MDLWVEVLHESLSRATTDALALRPSSSRLDFGIACTAHELKGPLVGVRAAVDACLEATDPAERNDLLLRSSDELRRLSRVVQSMLGWAVGSESLKRSPVDIVDVVRRAVDWCTLEWGKQRVHVEAPENVIVQGDPEYLQGAIANLVRNALEYSPPDSRVIVDLDVANGHVQVSVRNSGTPIPEAEQEAIFQPLVRGQETGPGGWGRGLGLFIARRTIEAHGGSIWIDSSDRGTTFIVLLAEAGTVPSVRPRRRRHRVSTTSSSDTPSTGGKESDDAASPPMVDEADLGSGH
jgi:two-component system sensor histidine kinase KdpD